MLIRRLLPFLCAIGLALCVPAFAATTISDHRTTPVKTSDLGDITIDNGGSVIIDTPGAAVTINSNNAVRNSGKIVNNAKTGAIGVLLVGGGDAALFNLSGTVTVSGKDATGGIGIEVDESGFEGDISLAPGSSVAVAGGHSTGLAIFGPLIGDVKLNGSIIATGDGATAVFSAAPITGSLTIGGDIEAKGTATPSTSKANPQSGPAIAIGADITEGILIIGPDSKSASVPAAKISSEGSKPALYISPKVAGAGAADLTIGIVADPDNLNETFSILNRGLISAKGLDPGVDAIAFLIEGDDAGHTATLEGGLYNGGNITALANSGDKPSNALAADAVAIEIGDGGIVPIIDIAPTVPSGGHVAATSTGLGGGSATAIQIDEGGELDKLTNSGTITASVVVSDPSNFSDPLFACAICDYSGTLTTIENTGTISATTTELDDPSLTTTIAADLSHAAAGTDIVFLNKGKVNGDILFGDSNDRLDIQDGGIVVGDVSFGAGTNILNISGSSTAESFFSGTIAYDLSAGGTLNINVGPAGELRTSSADATSLNVAQGGTVVFVLGATGPAPGSNEGIITTTGTAAFAGGSTIGFGFDASLPDSGDYALLYAGGGLTFGGGPDNPVKLLSTPYIYSINIDVPNANELVAEFERKTANCTGPMTPTTPGSTCLGISGNQASIYGEGDLGSESYMNSPLMQAARSDNALGAALMSLVTRDQFTSALDSLLPDLSGGTRDLAIAITDQATGVVGARQRTLTTYANSSAGLNLWGQEYFHLLNNDGDSSAPGYDAKGFGFALGADSGSPQDGRFGGAFSFFAGNSQENAPRHSKTRVEWYMATLYSTWRGHVLFFNTQATGGYGTFEGTRLIEVGTLKRTAKGRWSDYLAAGGVSTGLIFTSGSFVFSPLVNVDALFMHENSYSEFGAGSESLDIQSHNQKSLRAFIGLDLRNNFELEDGYFQPELRAGWSHDFLNDPVDLTASFSDVPNATAFSLTGPTPDASRFVAGTSLTWAYRSWSLGFNYDVTASSGGLGHAGVITLTGRI